MTWVDAVPPAVWGGLIGSSTTYAVTYFRERRRINDAYRTPQREALGSIIGATNELKVALTEVVEHAGLTGRRTSDEVASASMTNFQRALLGVEKAFAIGKITVVEAACYEQMMIAYNEYSQLRRNMDVEAIAGRQGFVAFIEGLKKHVEILDTETIKLVTVSQDRLSPMQTWRNRIKVKVARQMLIAKYSPNGPTRDGVQG
ncbi:hypothetical protein [Rhodococcoides fascians]|uniref:hypothetical protein n=1 Tax=Rhodococcoides fascians TaxID=1828 RepID=UPI0012D2B4CB|nr:hypothetical protein [Rhodococcus fascians]